MPDVRAALADRPLVLDGGLGTMLEARGHDLTGSLWSAGVLLDSPGDVRAVHADFVAAGADVVTTASYQLGYDNLAAAGHDQAAVDALLAASVRLAREAAEGRAWVAASVGPFGAVRADGSEYTGAYGVSVADLTRWHRRRIQVLADAAPDLLALETIASPAEVEAVVAALEGVGVPAWIALSAASTAFDDAGYASALAVAAAAPEVIAVGANCCPPSLISTVLDRVPAGVAAVAYPNSGETWDAASRSWHGDAGATFADADAWMDAGARLIGGCCRTTPTDIAGLVHQLES
ncbi:homocysteine S-methyltransferase [Microbacterium oleivorans]|uniref:Homocysteine/selenocysteine methylase n=1 Tax=Microbacterium oleivorans TaxID=273677 RepID=A0A031G044_9MICO|nr:homocysteine S-methyltransferase [Microbacterium oleivorans]EZP29255.1 Homocysteine/selenocysteine methylase [Microbacterium oleivorans]